MRNEDTGARAYELYRQGRPWDEIAREVGESKKASRRAIERWARRTGRTVEFRRPDMTPDRERARMAAWVAYCSGEPWTAILAEARYASLSSGSSALKRWARRRGLDVRASAAKACERRAARRKSPREGT